MKKIIDYLKGYRPLSGRVISEDYLGPKSGSISLSRDGGEKILKSYTSGDMLCQENYKILIRHSFTGEATELLKGLCDYISEEAAELPTLSEDKTPQYFEVTDCPSLVKTETGGGIYQMKFRLVYYRKGV